MNDVPSNNEASSGTSALSAGFGGDAVAAWQHSANEWADATANALQWLRNIRVGISTPGQAIADMEAQIEHCRNTDTQARSVTPNASLSGASPLFGEASARSES